MVFKGTQTEIIARGYWGMAERLKMEIPERIRMMILDARGRLSLSIHRRCAGTPISAARICTAA
jgi:hypothetical protein